MDTKWVAVGRITSDRHLDRGEKLHITLIDHQCWAVIEEVDFSPSSEEIRQPAWTKALADYINRHSIHLRAGVKNADETFITQLGSDSNMLWTDAGTTCSVLSTACSLDEWVELQTLRPMGSLPTGSIVTVRLGSGDKDACLQTIEISSGSLAQGRSWPEYLASTINQAGGLLRAGEKDDTTQTFVVTGRSETTSVWVPSRLALSLRIDVAASADAQRSATAVYEAVCEQSYQAPPAKDVIDQWLTGFAGGKFQDIVYPPSSIQVSDVTGLYTHLERLFRIASYLFRQTPVPSDYVSSVLEGLNFYAQQDYQTKNWWDRQIGLAKLACRAAVLLAKHLQSHELMPVFIPYAMKTTNTYAYTQAGANLADFASIQLIWGICGWKNSSEDYHLNFVRASSIVLSRLCLPVERYGEEHGEGISVDHSISQHNPRRGEQYCTQLYSGGYGHELLARITEGLAVLKNEFALDATALAELIKLVIEGLGWTGYAGHLDYQTCGRGVGRHALRSNAAHANWARALLPFADEASKQVLNELITRVTVDETRNQYYRGGKVFWVNDYMTFIGAGFCVWAKAISTRTVGGESGNGENLKGYYMGAGTCFLSRHGKEYEGIQPVWNWQRLPGTTVEQVPDFEWPNIDWGTRMWGSHDFVGGVSDGKRSVLSMVLARENVTHAYKTVMAFENHVVCTGTKINTTRAVHPVVTSVNQCMAQGPVRYRDLTGSEHVLDLGQSVTASDIDMVYHDGFVYRFGYLWFHPSVTLELMMCSGSWADLNTGGSPEIIQHPVFSLWVNHKQGEEGSYFYHVIPAEDFPDAQSVLASDGTTVDFHLQGDVDDTVLATCFNVDTTLANSGRNERGFFPKQPCSYIYKAQDSAFSLTCADPTQTQQSLSFITEVDEEGYPSAEVTVQLPQGDDRGRAVSGVYPFHSKSAPGV